MIPPGIIKERWSSLVIAVVLGLMAGSVSAVELRVVTWNVQNGVGLPGTPAFAAVRETLERLAPDVIAFQEVDAQSAAPSNAAHFAHLRTLLDDLGFPTTRTHLATAGDGYQAQTFVSGDFGNSSQCVAVASRYPITRTVQIGRGVAGRREQTRFPLFVRIRVSDTAQDVALVAVHLKQGDTRADEFRRGVEALRVREFLAAEGLTGASHHVLVVGDMNEEINEPQTGGFPTAGVTGGQAFSDGSLLPLSYRLGSGVPDPLAYAGFPSSALAAVGLTVVAATQTDGVTDRTYTFAGNSRLDYVLVGGFTRAAGPVRAEVYHSGREPVGDGLPKAVDLPDPRLSLVASDHLPVVVDTVLEPGPALTFAIPAVAQDVGFEVPLIPVLASVSVSAPLDEALTVTIAPYRNAPLRPIPPVVIAAGETTATFPLVLEGSPFAPDRRITLVAAAEGHRSGIGMLLTRGTGVAGPLIFSQYTETPNGSSPKAIEVLNVTTREIDFAAEPLQVVSYASGATAGTVEVVAEFGRVPPGTVVVIGDSATGRHLVTQGLLATTDAAVTNAQTGTVFTDTGEPDGRAVYIKRGFAFNGDDALEVRLNARRCDVFGTIGQDPGAAWAVGGISTTNQNLSRRRTAITPSAGWTDPSLGFETVGATLATALVGFGAAPVLDDPYGEWAAARGLAGAAAAVDADADGDGVANGLEFAFGEDAVPVLNVLGAGPGQWQARIGMSVRQRLGTLRWGVAAASDLRDWRTRWEAVSPLAPPTGEFRDFTLSLPATTAPGAQIRFFVMPP